MALESLDELQLPPESSVGASSAALVQHAGAVLSAAHELREGAIDGWGFLGLQDAVEFASAVEEISRIADYLKLAAAAAIDRQGPAHALSVVPPDNDCPGEDHSTGGGHAAPEWNQEASGSQWVGASHLMTRARWREFRSTADFMRARLRISRAEARRRLTLAASVLCLNTPLGETLKPAYPRLAEACADAALAASDVDVITHALEEALPRLEPEAFEAMEKQLTDIGAHQDHDFLVRTAKHWVALLDQDQPPTAEELSQFQGIFPGRRRNGLNHLHIYCTDEQHEALTTLISSAANPRLSGPETEAMTGGGTSDRPGTPEESGRREDPGPETGTLAPAAAREDSPGPVLNRLPRPTRPQLLLEGLLNAVRAALASGGLPATGGLRPQVLVTISHDALLAGLEAGTGMRLGFGENGRNTTGMAAFTGPIGSGAVRRMACDADLIPVVLGSKGQVLDLGRAARLFPPHLRKALHARDRGCAFPGCTVPGPWTEAHHVTFWEHGGGTGIGNGVLLCSFHHHLIHQGNWKIHLRAGIPWFRPPAYVDPERLPLRNTYFHPGYPASGGADADPQVPPDNLSA